MSIPASDATIPVLTQIIEPQPSGSAASKPLPEPGGRVDQSGSRTTQEWDALESNLNEHILRQLQGRIDFVLEHRIKDGLADILQTATEGLAAEIRQGLHKTLNEVISRAVAQEIARIQTKK